jgi:hypothetical protein
MQPIGSGTITRLARDPEQQAHFDHRVATLKPQHKADMNFKILTPSQAEQFIREGYVVVRQDFGRSIAGALLPLAWQELAINS